MEYGARIDYIEKFDEDNIPGCMSQKSCVPCPCKMSVSIGQVILMVWNINQNKKEANRNRV